MDCINYTLILPATFQSRRSPSPRALNPCPLFQPMNRSNHSTVTPKRELSLSLCLHSKSLELPGIAPLPLPPGCFCLSRFYPSSDSWTISSKTALEFTYRSALSSPLRLHSVGHCFLFALGLHNSACITSLWSRHRHWPGLLFVRTRDLDGYVTFLRNVA